MSTVQEYLDQIESLGTLAKVGICFALLGVVLLSCKYFVLRPFGNLVTRSKAKWDDALLAPLSNRLYFFVTVAGTQLSLLWVLEQNTEFNESLFPLFSVIYILTTTSILSTGIKHLLPVILGRFSAKSSVTVSGGNPLIVFLLRGVTYFVGLNLALSELDIELLGLFASLAVFSLIIGLAVQQTLGNIVNSFMLAVDRPFEVGDRIEVDGMVGTVISMGILSTKVLDRDEKLVVIPNNTLISSTLINHARGGGDGIARRISVVVDIGVDYRESIDHVKVIMLGLARDCPYTIDAPEPRVLLVELGDFAKVLRLYTWVADYSDEWVTRDWLLKSLDERFEDEHIRIPFPTSVELAGDEDEMLSQQIESKESKQRAAKRQMSREDRDLRKQRDDAREELEDIQERLRDTSLTKEERAEFDNRAMELSKTLTMFDTDDD
ncbi:MAG: hypothetical protein CL967_00410 [Euryarchaeota archaeon]|nr:hypothetical protein [Euryarchaeota archaeon]|tara:strand:- start:847 stop:2154 length:1308 start_codon:yes stop_codon:yes gene_type:complete